MTENTVAQANKRLIQRLVLVVVGMFGFGFAMVPLYDVFCEITGLNGKTASQAVAQADISGEVATDRLVTVEFVANVNQSAPWRFKPAVTKMKVHPGEFYHTSYYAENLTERPRVAQASPSVSPGLAAQHFQKIECFCFTRQEFAPGEGRDMPVTFRLDPDLSEDITTVTPSYTFFEIEQQGS